MQTMTTTLPCRDDVHAMHHGVRANHDRVHAIHDDNPALS
jgi:hypothetical protein